MLQKVYSKSDFLSLMYH